MSAEHSLTTIATELRRIRRVLERIAPPPEDEPEDEPKKPRAPRRIVVF